MTGCRINVGLVHLLLVVTATVAAYPQQAEETYQWPLELPRALSSSFGEYRPGRFHAGIDLRTGGAIGRPVYAAATGHVSRVRCSPWGYGKAVYLQFDDGNTAVYAHLDDFFPELRDWVRSQQHSAKSYIVDLRLSPDHFPVEKGALIAKSGATGAGPPHLHYELRDRRGRPFNPRLVGIHWPDTTKPIIRKVVVAPLDPNSTVNGDFTPSVLEVEATGDGAYRSQAVRASGNIGVGVDVVDPGNNGILLGIHTLRLEREGREYFRIAHDHLSYDNLRHSSVAYHPFLADAGRFLLLWRWPDNMSDVYRVSNESGQVHLLPAPSELRVEAVDFMGNTASLIIPVIPETPSFADLGEIEKREPRSDPATGKVALACYGAYLTITATFSAPEALPPHGMIESGRDMHSPRWLRISERAYQAAWAPETADSYTIHVHHPRMEPYVQRIDAVPRGVPEQTLQWGSLRLNVNPKSPFGVLFVRAFPAAEARNTPLRMLGTPWRLWPEAMPIDHPVRLFLPVDPEIVSSRRIGIYQDTRTGWRFVGGAQEGNHMVAELRSFGTFAVMEDHLDPLIADISPSNHYRAETRRPILRATITDRGSGIASFSIHANGNWLLAAYDPDENRLAWERDHELPSGPLEVEFLVTDHAGNSAVARRMLHIP